jgi:hypothetical protein
MDVFVTTIIYTVHANSAINTNDILLFVDAIDGGTADDADEAQALTIAAFNAQLTTPASIRRIDTQLFSYA